MKENKIIINKSETLSEFHISLASMCLPCKSVWFVFRLGFYV